MDNYFECEASYQEGYDSGYRTGYEAGYENGLRIGQMTSSKHGHWILSHRYAGHAEFECSVCGRTIDTRFVPSERYPFCHCGAQMDCETE